MNEVEIEYPTQTPLLADAVHFWHNFPLASDLPPRNLQTGTSAGGGIATGMRAFAIPRHGSRPNPVPTAHPAERPLPGAINVAFYDGHVELVRIERLWRLNWHRDYKPLPKRPGLR